jgi:hypothetical protein
MHDYYPLNTKVDRLFNQLQNYKIDLFDIQYEKKNILLQEDKILRNIELIQKEIDNIIPAKTEVLKEREIPSSFDFAQIIDLKIEVRAEALKELDHLIKDVKNKSC